MYRYSCTFITYICGSLLANWTPPLTTPVCQNQSVEKNNVQQKSVYIPRTGKQCCTCPFFPYSKMHFYYINCQRVGCTVRGLFHRPPFRKPQVCKYVGMYDLLFLYLWSAVQVNSVLHIFQDNITEFEVFTG